MRILADTLALSTARVRRREWGLREHVAADEDGPGGGEEAGSPEEAGPEGARYRFPGYGVAGEVEPGLELVGEQVGVEGDGEAEAGGEPEEQHEDHGAHARADRVVGGGGQEDRERGERHQGHGDEASASPNERDAAPDAYRGTAQPSKGGEAAGKVAGGEPSAGGDRRGGETVEAHRRRFG